MSARVHHADHGCTASTAHRRHARPRSAPRDRTGHRHLSWPPFTSDDLGCSRFSLYPRYLVDHNVLCVDVPPRNWRAWSGDRLPDMGAPIALSQVRKH